MDFWLTTIFNKNYMLIGSFNFGK